MNYVFVSGGADSVLLAHIVKELKSQKKNKNQKFTIVHIEDHSLPEEEVVLAKNIVTEIAKDFDAVMFIKDSSQNLSAHHDTIKKVMSDLHKSGDVFYFGHNYNDVIEQFFVDLCNVRNPSSFGESRCFSLSGHEIVRPLIKMSKQEILKKCEKLGLIYIDSSFNKLEDNLRGYIRNNFIPHLEALGKDNSYAHAMRRGIEEFKLSYNLLKESAAANCFVSRFDPLDMDEEFLDSVDYLNPKEFISIDFIARENPIELAWIFSNALHKKLKDEYPYIPAFMYMDFISAILFKKTNSVMAIDFGSCFLNFISANIPAEGVGKVWFCISEKLE